MYPEDRVLVGVIARQRDLRVMTDEGWYRIPHIQMPRGVDAEYVAFFTGRQVHPARPGGIYTYALVTGLELAYRRDLLPQEADHPRAGEVYYRVALGPIQQKTPPILNPAGRRLSFIMTTWDRFVAASTIADLYSRESHFVDRFYHALR